MNDSQREFETLLRDGISAVKNGQHRLAQSVLRRAVLLNQGDARPYIWLSAATQDPAEQRDYLEQAVIVDPGNATARRGLAILAGKLNAADLLAVGEGIDRRKEAGPEEAESEETFQCPQCGAALVFDPGQNGLACQFCGTLQPSPARPEAGSPGQDLDMVLPTRRGHRWSEAQHALKCENCGASSLWQPGLTAVQCPYCGSNQLIESQEIDELVDPQAIALVRVNEQQAARCLKDWLGRGWFAPDDLVKMSKTAALRCAYYSFWMFDGTLKVQWACEVNEGSSKDPDWRPISGTELHMFRREIVPGCQSLSSDGLKDAGRFDWDKLVEFKPEQLAGWPAMMYDRSLAQASLDARQQVLRKARPILDGKIAGGRTKRNLNLSTGGWLEMSFKHLLLPFWVGTYVYRGKTYEMLVNGQTGAVGGSKPRDKVKVVMSILILLLLLFVLSWLLGDLAQGMLPT